MIVGMESPETFGTSDTTLNGHWYGDQAEDFIDYDQSRKIHKATSVCHICLRLLLLGLRTVLSISKFISPSKPPIVEL